MADASQIEQLRRLTALAEDDPIYTNEVLGLYIDNLGSVEAAAGAVWKEKAAALVGLVDVTESGSSRRLSQLYDQALKMGGAFGSDDDDTGEPGRASFTVGIERV